jgi:hypothetical protein
LAPPKGLEPLTDWLTASRSTGLSYGGTAQRYALSVSQKYLSLVISLQNADFYLPRFALGYSREDFVEFLQKAHVPFARECPFHQVIQPIKVVFHTLKQQLLMQLCHSRFSEPILAFQSAQRNKKQGHNQTSDAFKVIY